MSLPSRSEQNSQYCWDLTPLYASQADWDVELNLFESEMSQVTKFQGRLGESASTLAEALETTLRLKQLADKLFTYARFQSDVDTSSALALGHVQRISNTVATFTALTSFIRPEVLSIRPEVLDELLKAECLQRYRRMLDEIVRFRPHTLSLDEERLLAMGMEVFDTADKIFSQLNNADLQFEPVVIDGKSSILSHATYSVYLRHANRSVRKEAFEKYYGAYDAHKHTIATTLTCSVQKDAYLAEAQRYSSAIEKALFSEHIETKVYDNLIATVAEFLAPLHKYYTLRKKILKLEEQCIFDSYVQLVPNVDIKTPYNVAVDHIVESLQPLGAAYTTTLKRGLTSDRWVDVYENRGKRSGAYSGGCYDSFPYILMNYREDDLRAVFTLAHEAGHSMHSYHSQQRQSYQDSFYTIFVAEVASTFNEQLLTRYLKKKFAGDRAILAYLINQQIDDIKATLYRQTMFAEFELIIHGTLAKNRPLTLDVYREVYGRLLQKYFGPSVTVLRLDELEFLRIPHFYSAFYVFKYATGLSAALALVERVLSEGEEAVARYLNFLSGGCSKAPLDLLRDAGVDMASPAPIATACKLFSTLVDELEGVLE